MPEPAHRIEVARALLRTVEEAVGVVPGPKQRRQFRREPQPDDGNRLHPHWFDLPTKRRLRAPLPVDPPAATAYCSATWCDDGRGSFVPSVNAPHGRGRWYLWDAVAYRGLVARPGGSVWPTVELGTTAVDIEDGRVTAALAAARATR